MPLVTHLVMLVEAVDTVDHHAKVERSIERSTRVLESTRDGAVLGVIVAVRDDRQSVVSLVLLLKKKARLRKNIIYIYYSGLLGVFFLSILPIARFGIFTLLNFILNFSREAFKDAV